MNQKSLLVIMLSAFILTIAGINFAGAQIPVVPAPVCTPVHEQGIDIPCPDDTKVSPAAAKQTPTQSVPKTGESQTFNDLFQSIGKTLDGTMSQIFAGLTGFFDGVKNFFQNIKL